VPTAIRFQNVSKRYILHKEQPYSFLEVVVNLFNRRQINSREEFWALKNVSFQIEHGQAVGFIGPNGAGKSSILKLVARTNLPTGGRVEVNGRVSALLELGTGFHPDLTGRENIYLNGSLMGFSRAEMKRHFDDIVRFSEIGRFIDVPVRNYSSGMYVRLAFAVAVHVTNEILLIDEVLAVGDEDFQRKCMDKMGEFKRTGKTMILVSHGLESVRNLCDHVIWLENGGIIEEGNPADVIDHYLQAANLKTKERMDQLLAQRRGQQAEPGVHTAETDRPSSQPDVETVESGGKPETGPHRRWGTGEIRIERVQLLDQNERESSIFETGGKMTVRMWYNAPLRTLRPVFGMALYRPDGTLITGPNTLMNNFPVDWVQGHGHIDYTIAALPLLRGLYELSAAVYDETLTHPHDHHERLYSFRVEPRHLVEGFGIVALSGTWKHAADDGRGDH
jgi:lipopolysaccharide transport system ATP-binding protein